MSSRTRALARATVTFFIFLLVIFVPAGSFHYWQAWTYVVIFAGSSLLITHYLYRHDPELLKRRLQNREESKEQKLFRRVSIPLWMAGFVVSGLDFRFGWSADLFAPVPAWVTIASEVLFVLSFVLLWYVFRFNTFASSTIRIETGQHVISSGPYAVVRHPLYSSLLILIAFTPFALGSYISLPIFELIIPVLIYRLTHEERLLRQELAGYTEYCKRVRYRLVPLLF